MESCSHYEFSLFPLALGNWEPETKKVGFVIYSIDTAYNQSLGHFPTFYFFLGHFPTMWFFYDFSNIIFFLGHFPANKILLFSSNIIFYDIFQLKLSDIFKLPTSDIFQLVISVKIMLLDNLPLFWIGHFALGSNIQNIW